MIGDGFYGGVCVMKLTVRTDGRQEPADIAVRLQGFWGLQDKEPPQATGPEPGLRHFCTCLCAWMCVCGLNEPKKPAEGPAGPHLFTFAFPSWQRWRQQRKCKKKKALGKEVVRINIGGFVPFLPSSFLFLPLLRHTCHSIIISQPPVPVCQIHPELSLCLQLWTGKKMT